jgi:transaldolase / glucose-6-phosphate isomerase
MSATTGVNERLAALTAAGTSVWLDLLRRSMVEGGELQRMVDEDSLRGVTSNPAIFEKAILGSTDYDDQLEQCARDGVDGRETYRRLVVRDVQRAADVLRRVWDDTDRFDGYVSLEVEPDLANDTEGTLESARLFWERVDRPNLMIKIPGTDAGVPAIEQAIYEGINVNVTLLFSVESYTNIAEAFIKGLERRQAEGKSLDVHSVASFFVSRVDTEVDKRLEKLGREDLRGIAGLANARAAYQRFKEIFHGERFAKLREAGAPVQRPLWASTGVKDPRYPDTMYVDGLVAPETVNTMPLETLMAAADHAEIKGATADQDPSEDLAKLADAGIDMTDVTKQLLEEGIDKFVAPMLKLMAGIESQREAVVTGRPRTFESSLPPDLEQAVAQRIAQAREEDVARRVWRKDPALWGGTADTPELSNRLGWLTVAEALQEELPDLKAFAQQCAADGLTDAVLLGMGGSSLAPEVFRQSFETADGALRLHVLDSTDPAAVLATEQAIDLDKTLFIVSSKSGGTIETLSHFAYFWDKVRNGDQFIAITDPGSPLTEIAREHAFRRVFEADPDIGGRYSALSHFGIVPATLMGADVDALLEGAQVAAQGCRHEDTSEGNSGLWLGATLGEASLRGRDKLTFVVDDPEISTIGLWLEQLVAESTGKHGKGILPVAGEPVGAPEVYGDDRVFLHLRGEGASLDDEMTALAEADQPVITVPTKGAADLGRIFFFAEFATAVSGWALGINPFDQPNVQEAKDNTKKVLDAGDLPDLPDSLDDGLTVLIAEAAPPAYIAIMAYVAPSEAFDEAIEELRRRLRDGTHATTTFGYGPRFLHSTGQFHKGGPPTGRFLQLIGETGPDVEVPDKPYTFRHLKQAQAAGDMQTLESHSLPVKRVRLKGDDLAAAVREIGTKIEEMGC